MAENTAEVIVGTGVLAIAAGFLIYAVNAGDMSVSPKSYPLKASFRSAEGVRIGSDVRMAGVKVGTITDLELNPTSFRADATFSVQ